MSQRCALLVTEIVNPDSPSEKRGIGGICEILLTSNTHRFPSKKGAVYAWICAS